MLLVTSGEFFFPQAGQRRGLKFNSRNMTLAGKNVLQGDEAIKKTSELEGASARVV